ncbi:hypothetical protein OS493_036433 [Desmophyllum pertusum]|uniref:TGF-beta family profile domain-containing protein n=1 Tax=Desmophyllum pertusum TaxID=174260 RepID=A0A9W9YUW0_9CNID|nr:hypothetical protein OS493_036433 [Desmophyllum pertusum]
MQENLQLSLDIAVKGTKSLEIDGGDVSGNGGPLHPFLAVDTEEKQQVNRQKRQVVDECPVTQRTCCLHETEVNFHNINWNFVVYPESLTFSVCAGSCVSPGYYRKPEYRLKAFTRMNSPKHACCVPTTMDSVLFIIIDEFGEIETITIPNMKPRSCHCIV